MDNFPVVGFQFQAVPLTQVDSKIFGPVINISEIAVLVKLDCSPLKKNGSMHCQCDDISII
jgi:hypothetical protein